MRGAKNIKKTERFRQFLGRNYLEGGDSESRGDIRSVREIVHENIISREMCQDYVFERAHSQPVYCTATTSTYRE